MKIEFSSQRREMLLFLTTNMAAVTSRANQQLNVSKNVFTSDSIPIILFQNYVFVKY